MLVRTLTPQGTPESSTIWCSSLSLGCWSCCCSLELHTGLLGRAILAVVELVVDGQGWRNLTSESDVSLADRSYSDGLCQTDCRPVEPGSRLRVLKCSSEQSPACVQDTRNLGPQELRELRAREKKKEGEDDDDGVDDEVQR